jgi:hypothetical protein
LAGLRNRVLNTLKEQTGKHQQGMLQPVAHWEEEYEVLRREEIMLYVQHTRGGLVTSTDVPIHRSVYEPGIIVGKYEESNEAFEIAQRLLDYNGKIIVRIHTQSNGRGDQHTSPPNA